MDKHQSFSLYKTKSVATDTATLTALSRRLDGSCLRLSVNWQAHADSVTNVGLLCNGTTLATCSYDCVVHLWEAQSGKCQGSLYQGSTQERFVDKNWNFSIDSSEQSARENMHARKVLARVREMRADDGGAVGAGDAGKVGRPGAAGGRTASVQGALFPESGGDGFGDEGAGEQDSVFITAGGGGGGGGGGGAYPLHASLNGADTEVETGEERASAAKARAGAVRAAGAAGLALLDSTPMGQTIENVTIDIPIFKPTVASEDKLRTHGRLTISALCDMEKVLEFTQQMQILGDGGTIEEDDETNFNPYEEGEGGGFEEDESDESDGPGVF
jgi:hypothetical protein